MDEKEKEIRNILVGLVRYEGSFCISADGFLSAHFSGFNLGSDSARMLPLIYRAHQFSIQGNADTTKIGCREGLYKIGQPVLLKNTQDVISCLVRPLFAPPVLVVMEEGNKQITLRFYTARTIYSSMGIRAVQKKISSCFPDNLMETDVTFKAEQSSYSQREKKRAAKAEKKAVKEQKKAAKKAARGQKKEEKKNDENKSGFHKEA